MIQSKALHRSRSSLAAAPHSFPQYYPPTCHKLPRSIRDDDAPRASCDISAWREGDLPFTSPRSPRIPLPSCLLSPCLKNGRKTKTKTNTAGTHFTRSSEGRRAPAVSDLEVLPVTFDPRSPEAAARVHCRVNADIWLYSNEAETYEVIYEVWISYALQRQATL